MLNKDKILNRLSFGNIVLLDIVDSTNQYIIDNILYFHSGDACVAEHQTHGRGRFGKKWISSFGQNICLSIYWKLYRILFYKIPWSLIISVIIARVLKNLGASHIKIKWPNDLYAHGCKLAGILIEMLTQANGFIHIIIGVGINVSMNLNQQFSLYIEKKWINLKDIGVVCDRNTLVSMLLYNLRRELKIFECYKFNYFILYQKFYMYLYDKPIVFLDDNNISKYGYFFGINNNGEIIVKDQFGGICCCSGKKNIIYIDF